MSLANRIGDRENRCDRKRKNYSTPTLREIKGTAQAIPSHIYGVASHYRKPYAYLVSHMFILLLILFGRTGQPLFRASLIFVLDLPPQWPAVASSSAAPGWLQSWGEVCPNRHRQLNAQQRRAPQSHYLMEAMARNFHFRRTAFWFHRCVPVQKPY